MLCEKILGKLEEMDVKGRRVEYVEIEWHEAFKKIHRKTSDQGTDVGIRMDDSVLARGLFQGDVIYADEEVVVAVSTPPCEVIEISLTPGHDMMAAKVCYEIGNRHAPLFWGENGTYITIYDEPMMAMVTKIHGVRAEKKLMKLDFDKRISAAIHNHHH
jgi:urease accessory protein